MAENVRVVVRCRPMNKKEQNIDCKTIIQIEDCSVIIQNPADLLAPTKTFTFDNAYAENDFTESLYNDICYALVENVLEGYNGTIFAYGQTGCGKSYTMQGPDNVDLVSTQRGIISRSFDHIFEAISVATGVQFLALISYLEIYNESIRDLLASNDGINNTHALKEVPGEGVTVPSLSTHTVHNAKECDELLRIGEKNRMVGATLMNANSSRSHSIFTISLEQIETTPKTNTINKKFGIRKGKLNLVDLAGSERQNKTGAAGDRLKEATKINLSLSALGNVISALVDGKTKHIPYRDSKLTRLLQDSLGGNTKTLMIACISPADYNYGETLSTLRYASRAKNISNKPKINEDPKDAMLRNYQEEILKLKKMLESTQMQSFVISDDNTHWLETEKFKLQQEYELETNRLKEEHAAQQKEKEDLVRDMQHLKTHFDNQLKDLNSVEANNNQIGVSNLNEAHSMATHSSTASMEIQLEVQNRIETIKNALIGGERANDTQLKEKRHKKKLAAQGRLSALAHALGRVEQSEDRNLLQGHYSDIHQELKAKNESLKSYRQKIRALEREVSDLQSEFQLDRADYLESIRRLEKNMKFYQQLLEMALPILRKDGKYWDPDEIMCISSWNDDLKNWRLPEDSMNSFKLPLAASAPSGQTQLILDCEQDDNGAYGGEEQKSNEPMDNDFIASNYFRPRRNFEFVHQRKGFNNWKDFTKRNRHSQQSPLLPNSIVTTNPIVQQRNFKSNWMNLSSATSSMNNNRVLSSWLPQNHRSMSKTWSGLTSQLPLSSVQKIEPSYKDDPAKKEVYPVNYKEGFLPLATLPIPQASVRLYPLSLESNQSEKINSIPN